MGHSLSFKFNKQFDFKVLENVEKRLTHFKGRANIRIKMPALTMLWPGMGLLNRFLQGGQ